MSEIRDLDKIRELDARIRAGGKSNASFEELLAHIQNSPEMAALQAPPAEQVQEVQKLKKKQDADGFMRAIQRMKANRDRRLQELRDATVRNLALGAQPGPGIIPFPEGYKPYQDNFDGIPIGVDRAKLSDDTFNYYYGMEKKQ